MKAEKRRAVPMKLQRDLALKLCADLMRQAGMVPVEVTPKFELDHVPALALRDFDPATGEHRPHQHDPAHLVWMTKEAHAAKTFGNGATTRGADAGDIAHHRRLSAKEMEFRARLLAKEHGTEPPAEKRKKPFGQRPKPPRKPQNSTRRPDKFNFGIAQS
jgi:hypothetical protein